MYANRVGNLGIYLFERCISVLSPVNFLLVIASSVSWHTLPDEIDDPLEEATLIMLPVAQAVSDQRRSLRVVLSGRPRRCHSQTVDR